jgi:preprotein translocase subunit SecF
MQVSYSQPADLESIRGQVSALGYQDIQVQNFGTSRDVMIRLPSQKGVSSAQQSEKVLASTEGGPTPRVRCVEPSSSARRWARNWPTTALTAWRW